VGEWHHLIAIQAVEDHRIQPDTIEPAFHGAVDAPQYGVEIADASNGLETLGLQAVEADVNCVHAGVAQGVSRVSKMAAISSQRQRVEPRQCAESLE